MAGGMPLVVLCQLRNAIWQIRNTDLLSARLQNAIQTPEVERRQILPIRVARPVLNRAGDADHALRPAVVRSDLGIRDWPIHVMTIQSCSAEIVVSYARRRPSPDTIIAVHS